MRAELQKDHQDPAEGEQGGTEGGDVYILAVLEERDSWSP